jgi:Tol biopolymer transport system component
MKNWKNLTRGLMQLILAAVFVAGMALLIRLLWPSGSPSAPPMAEKSTPALETLPTIPSTPVVTAFPTSQPPLPDLAASASRPFSLVYRDGELIYTIRSDGSGEKLVADLHEKTGLYMASSQACAILDWGRPSPDGKTLAVTLCNANLPHSSPRGQGPEYSIYAVDLASGDTRLLIPNGVEPVWSHDGQKIAYRGIEGLQVFDLATRQSRLVVASRPQIGEYPELYDWSPDDRQIVFVAEIVQVSRAIAKVDLASGESKVLAPASTYFPTLPRWSPDGSKIVFISDEGKSSGYMRFTNLWIMNADGSEARQLTFDMTIDSPQWSPDGHWIAFTGSAGYIKFSYSDLWVMAETGTDFKRLTANLSPDAQLIYATWSPDGIQILVSRNRKEILKFSLFDFQPTALPAVTRDYRVLPSDN